MAADVREELVELVDGVVAGTLDEAAERVVNALVANPGVVLRALGYTQIEVVADDGETALVWAQRGTE